MRVYGCPTRLAEAHQRQVTALSNFNRQRGRGRDRKKNFHPAHRRLLHHFIAGAAGDERRTVLPGAIIFRAVSEEFVQRHVAANVFVAARELAGKRYPSRRMRAAGKAAYRLKIPQMRQRAIEVRQIERLGKRQRPQ